MPKDNNGNKNRNNPLFSNINESDMDKLVHEVVELERKRERMYHYTSLDTFMAILSGVKDSAFIFHAGSVYTMNDSEEMKRGYDYIKKYLSLVEKELNVPKDDRLLNMTKNVKDNKNIKMKFGEWMINDDNTNFVVSFSAEPDILPMWALYGNNGAGVCLEFSPYVIEKYYKEKNIDSNLQIEKCVYEEDDIKDFLLRNLKIVYKLFLEQESDEKKKIPLVKAKYLATMCGLTGAYVKHPGFEYEKEIRMNVFRHIDLWKFKETRYGHQSAYVEVPIPIEALTKILIGPAANMDYVKNPLIMRLRTRGIKIEPKQSKIPFRIY